VRNNRRGKKQAAREAAHKGTVMKWAEDSRGEGSVHQMELHGPEEGFIRWIKASHLHAKNVMTVLPFLLGGGGHPTGR